MPSSNMKSKYLQTLAAIFAKPTKANIRFGDIESLIKSLGGEIGLTPAKPYSGKLTLRVSPAVHAEIAAVTAHSGKSINKWVADTLAQVVHSH